MQVSKSPKINLRTVRRTIRDEAVTGTDLHRCAINIGGHLGSHPSCVGKIEDILEKLVAAEQIYLQDAMLRIGKNPRRARCTNGSSRVATRRDGRISERLGAPVIGTIPAEWQGCDPDEYASPPTDYVGGWDDDAVFGHHCEWAKNVATISALAAEQFIDGARSRGLAPSVFA